MHLMAFSRVIRQALKPYSCFSLDPMTNNTVHEARTGELEVAGHMLHDFNTEFGDPAPEPPVIAKRLDQLLQKGDTVVLLVGEPAHGLAVLRFRDDLWSDSLECYLAELYIKPAHRGRGSGRTLMNAVIDEAKARGASFIHINVDEPDTAARNLYESLGFSNHSGGSDGPLMFYYEREI